MGMRSVSAVDYVVIGLYALLMVLVGLYVMRFNRSAAEYFRGGSRIPWLVAGLSCFMSGFSAWTFTGAAGVAYRAGVAATGLYIGNALSFLLGYFVFAKRWRRSRITTMMEYLAGRFNRTTHQTFSWTTILFQLFTSASMLYGLSLFVSSACGFPVTWTILGAGSGVGNRLRQVILPTRPRHIVGTTMRIARGVETKIGIVNHIDEKTRGKFERDLLSSP